MYLESVVIGAEDAAARIGNAHRTVSLLTISCRFCIFFYHFWSAVDGRRGLPWQDLTLCMILHGTLLRWMRES